MLGHTFYQLIKTRKHTFYQFINSPAETYFHQLIQSHVKAYFLPIDQKPCWGILFYQLIKSYFYSEGNFIIAGSDDGKFFIWDRKTTNIIKVLNGDDSIVNCLQPHPTTCYLATSGIDPYVRIWAPMPENFDNKRVVQDFDKTSTENQRRMNADPFESFFMEMGYRVRDMSDNENNDDENDAGTMPPCRTS